VLLLFFKLWSPFKNNFMKDNRTGRKRVTDIFCRTTNFTFSKIGKKLLISVQITKYFTMQSGVLASTGCFRKIIATMKQMFC